MNHCTAAGEAVALPLQLRNFQPQGQNYAIPVLPHGGNLPRQGLDSVSKA